MTQEMITIVKEIHSGINKVTFSQIGRFTMLNINFNVGENKDCFQSFTGANVEAVITEAREYFWGIVLAEIKNN